MRDRGLAAQRRRQPGVGVKAAGQLLKTTKDDRDPTPANPRSLEITEHRCCCSGSEGRATQTSEGRAKIKALDAPPPRRM